VVSTRTIVIAGAGIGGLTAALALADRGFRVHLLDQAERLQETGAGIQLSANATRILIALGLRERLQRAIVAPAGLRVRKARTGREIVRLPFGAMFEADYGAPYWVVHRGDLQAALLELVRDHPDIVLDLGARVEEFAVHPHGVTVGLTRRGAPSDAFGLALVGADGLWSKVRARLGDPSAPRAAGRTAWRAVVPADRVAPEFRNPEVNLWLGPDSHLVHYPVRGGAEINIVAIAEDQWSATGWSTQGDLAEVQSRFPPGRWAEPARDLLAAPAQWLKWALFDRPPLRSWGHGPVTLLGDAAHPMLPQLAQGAAMAIEDAALLAVVLARSPADPAAALRAYERERQPRTVRVQKAACANSRTYHRRGFSAMLRNLAMVVLGGELLVHRYRWIYAWRAPSAGLPDR
jgi:salicylate hydroxylase